MTPVRLALIGYGKWGRNYVRAARASGEASVVKIVLSGDSPNLADARATGIETAVAIKGLDDVDAYVYAGHPAQAVILCEAVLACGKPVLAEKPAGLSLADAERIMAAERASKTFALVGHLHLFAEGFVRLRKDAANIPLRGSSCFGGDGPVRDYSALWDYGPHAVSTALALLGPSARLVDPQEARSEGFGGFRLRSDRGFLDCLASNTGQGRFGAVYAIKGSSPRYDAYLPQEQPLTTQVRAFANAVRAGGTDDWRFGAHWAVDVARVLSAVDSR